MRYFLLISLFTLALTTTVARPPQMEDRNESEAEQSDYEGNDDAQAEDNVQEEDDSRLSDQDASDVAEDEPRPPQLVKMGRGAFEPVQRSVAADPERPRTNPDNFAEYARSKLSDEEAATNNDFTSIPKRKQSNRYIDNSDINDPPENVHLTNYKTNRVQDRDAFTNELSKRTNDAHITSFDDNDSLYENNRESNKDSEKVEYNSGAADSHANARHFKQYYNAMQSEHKSMFDDHNYDMANRDRRQAEQSDSFKLANTSTEKESASDVSNEEDEAAIKRHIRKLSGEELEELLNSLSEDKKALLNKIMDGDNTYETLNKREITKKAGAVDENGFIDSSLSEISKVQGGPSIDINTEAPLSPNTDIENIKQQESQTETVDVSNTKASDTTRVENIENNKAEFMGQSDNANHMKPVSSLNNFNTNPDSSNAQPIRTESKREANLDYMPNADSSFEDAQTADNYVDSKDSDDSFNEQGHVCSQDDELAQLMDEESSLHSNEHQYKREVDNQADMDDSIKSLEDSFPNSNCEENGRYFETNMAPLVRVKRKNYESAVNKRAAALPEDKVAYFPYKAENDDEDNEEGGEFDDDGFYDRTSNYAKNNANKPADNIPSSTYDMQSPQTKLSKKQSDAADGREEESKPVGSPNDPLESDTTSLGSDTDSVLSGVEGVDDNLMFNSGSRNRRKADESEESDQISEIDQDRAVRSTPVLLDEAKPAGNYINLPNYQESEAFGPLPRSEGELNRFKRIRRVKPSLSSDVTAAGK